MAKKRRKKTSGLRSIFIWLSVTVTVLAVVLAIFIISFGNQQYVDNPEALETKSGEVNIVKNETTKEAETFAPDVTTKADESTALTTAEIIIMDIPTAEETETPTEETETTEEETIDYSALEEFKEYLLEGIDDPDNHQISERLDEKEKKLIFIGDSRFEGMTFFQEEKDVIFAQTGEGVDYLDRVMEKVLEIADEDTIAIVGLGVNGVPNYIENYLESLDTLVEKFPGKVFVTTVTPVNETMEKRNNYFIKNEDIDKFNSMLVKDINPEITIIDTASYMKNRGYECSDGLHYTGPVIENQYRYIRAFVAYSI